MPAHNVEYIMVIDRSGSMRTMGNEVVNGVNMFLKDQVDANINGHVSIIRFDNKVEVVCDRVDIAKVPEFDQFTFCPRGTTAFFDAMGVGICYMESTLELHSPSKVVFVVMTDGRENASHEFNQETIVKMVKEKREHKELPWEFVFLAANMDAVQVGASFGFSADACLTFDPLEETCHNGFKSLSSEVARFATTPGTSVEFSEMDRQRSVQSSSDQDILEMPGIPLVRQQSLI
jgi:uncharacterized protein YegL